MNDDFSRLQRRLQWVLWAFAALWLVDLAYFVWVGDPRGVALVHDSAWTQAHWTFLRHFTNWGLYPFYILFLALYAYGYRRRLPELKLIAGAYILAQLLGSAFIVRVLKTILGRARPDATHLPNFGSEWHGLSWDGAHNSFPSGHTADIVTSVLFATLVVRSPWAAVALLLWALALALSRLALASHYPTDVLGGSAVALLASVFVIRAWLLPRLRHLRSVAAMGWWRSDAPAPVSEASLK